MKRVIAGILIAATITATPVMASGRTMSVMYNPNTGEYVYTTNYAEKEMLDRAGWDEEGTGWKAPDTGKDVYRLYNPNAGTHHYTMSKGERDALAKIGWRYEGVAWKSGGDIPIYRLYNRKNGAHYYTAHLREANNMQDNGWRFEGIAWYGEDAGRTAS